MIGTKRSTIVTIANDELFTETLDNIMGLTQANLQDLKLYQSSWMEQIKVFLVKIFLSLLIRPTPGKDSSQRRKSALGDLH